MLFACLFDRHSLEVAGGLGPTAGQIFRIGLLGDNARREYVEFALQVLKDGLKATATSKL